MNLPLIQTERLVLKGISAEAMKIIFDELEKSEIMELLGYRSEEEYETERYKHLQGYASYNRSFILFLLVLKDTGKVIGRCGIHNWNKENNRAEIGYVMQEEEFKRKGYMAEAVNAVVNFGFNQLGLNRLEAIVGESNIASLKILEKFFFVKEGVLRNHRKSATRFEDSFILSLLAGEHFAMIV